MNEIDSPPTYVPGWSDPDLVKIIPYKQLGRTGMIVSQLGFGCAYLKLDRNQNSKSLAHPNVEAIQEAIRSGVNLIDTSPFYGQSRSEQCLGEALRDLPRSSFYLATKVGRHPDCSFDYGAKAVARSLESSLERLNVNHIDLVQIHDVEFCPSQEQLFNETLPVLDQFKRKGIIHHIGITGYPLTILR